MKSKLANRITLFIEIALTLFIVGIIVTNSIEDVRQEVLQYQTGLQADYARLLSAYTTEFKMMVNEITPQIEKDLSFDDMQAFMISKEAAYEGAIGADVYDGISFTYKGGYVHSWNYGDYSDYDPNTRPWYQTAQEANGEIAVTAPYVTYLNESELPNTDDYIVLTLTQKYNNEISFCYDIKTFAVNELLSNRYTRYPGTFAMMYDDSGYILSCTSKGYYCHNVYQADNVVTDDLVAAVKVNEVTKDKVDIAWVGNELRFLYCITDSSGNYYSVFIPFWEVMRQSFFRMFLIAFLLIVLEIWIYRRNNKQRETELQMERVVYTSQMKQDFLARMSHDMRTPMNGILGMTELSVEENDVDVLKTNMVKIHTAGEYLLGLINDSLDLQKMESGKFVLNPTVVSTSQLIRNSVDMVKLSAKEKMFNLL